MKKPPAEAAFFSVRSLHYTARRGKDAVLGVADGARTHDNRNHNPGLYQLSYSHRRERKYSGVA
jgi:hypothetical protein